MASFNQWIWLTLMKRTMLTHTITALYEHQRIVQQSQSQSLRALISLNSEFSSSRVVNFETKVKLRRTDMGWKINKSDIILDNKLRISLHIPPVQRKKQSMTHLLILPQLPPAVFNNKTIAMRQWAIYEIDFYLLFNIIYIQIDKINQLLCRAQHNITISLPESKPYTSILTLHGDNIPNQRKNFNLLYLLKK